MDEATQNELRNTLASVQRRLAGDGCGNNGCRRRAPTGAATNGSCECGPRTLARELRFVADALDSSSSPPKPRTAKWFSLWEFELREGHVLFLVTDKREYCDAVAEFVEAMGVAALDLVLPKCGEAGIKSVTHIGLSAVGFLTQP